MWWEEAISLLDDKKYTRQQLYEVLLSEKPGLTYNSFKWIIADMIHNGIILRQNRNKYVLNRNGVEKHIYEPSMDEQLQEISKKIQTRFPLVDYVCFESVQLNEFLNHLIGRNTFFLIVEKDTIDFVFRYLQDETDLNVLLRPNDKEWDAYCVGDNIVLLNLISEAPKCLGEYHSMSIEQLLVDIIAERSFRNLYSSSEIPEIYYLADKTYQIDYTRLMRYARRRSKADEIKKYIEEYTSAAKS